MIQLRKIFKFKSIVSLIAFSIINTHLALAEAPSFSNCEGVQGLKVLTDYSPDGKPFVRKIPTELFTSFTDDQNYTHLIVDQSKFETGNVEVSFVVLNKDKNPIKKFVLKSWLKDKKFPNQKILKNPISRLIKSKLTEPHDKFLNMSKVQKEKLEISKVPYDGKFYIGQKNKPAFCTFDFKYSFKYQ